MAPAPVHVSRKAIIDLLSALKLYIEHDECVCTADACPPECTSCMFCIADKAYRQIKEELVANAKFSLGHVVITPGALEAFHTAGDRIVPFLLRHVSGDWGELDEHDRKENEFSLRKGFRLLSAYRLSDGTKFWVITEADRSATTFLLPEEY